MTKKYQLFIPEYRTEEILENLRPIFASGWTGNGPKTKELEEKLSELTGIPGVHAVNSGTSALFLAVKLLAKKYNWDKDTEIITTPNTFVSTPHSIVYNNFKPIFADINLLSGNITAKEVVKAYESNKNIKAVMLVAMGGNSSQYHEIRKVTKELGIKLILDGAHCAGARDENGEILGIDADALTYSFHSVKPMPVADGGMVVFPKDQDLNELVRQYSWLGIDRSTFSRTLSSGAYKFKYNVPNVGEKMHYNDVNAVIALVSLKYLEKDNAYRRFIASCYLKNFKDVKELEPIIHYNWDWTSQHLFQVLINNRDETILALNQVGIFPGVHYLNNTNYPMYEDQFKNVPVAEKWGDMILTLPMHLGMTKNDVDYISQQLIKILKKNS